MSPDFHYFSITPNCVEIPLSEIVAREAPDPERVQRAHRRMMDAKAGKREKRKPLEVMEIEGGGYRVMDGNSTLQALKELRETTAVVTIRAQADSR
jgi:hypothetical protein